MGDNMKTGDSKRVRLVAEDEVADVVDVLWESFYEYPAMKYFIGAREDYGPHLRTLIHFFTMARFLRGEPVLGTGAPGDLNGVALVARSWSETPPELTALGEKTWAVLGADARARYETFSAAGAPFVVEAPHLHLSMIGARRAAQGSGVGRALLDHVHRMSADDDAATGVSLTTEVKKNVSLYEHFDYKVLGHAVVSPELETWSMFRRD